MERDLLLTIIAGNINLLGVLLAFVAVLLAMYSTISNPITVVKRRFIKMVIGLVALLSFDMIAIIVSLIYLPTQNMFYMPLVFFVVCFATVPIFAIIISSIVLRS